MVNLIHAFILKFYSLATFIEAEHVVALTDFDE